MMLFSTIKLQKRYELAVYKVAVHDDEILDVLYTKKNSMQQLIYIVGNINCREDLRVYLDEMNEMIDNTLDKIGE